MAGKNRPVDRRLEEEIRFLTEIGADFVFAPETKEGTKLALRRTAGNPVGAVPDSAAESGTSLKEKQRILKQMEEKVLRCMLCRLSQGRKRAVPGEGSGETPLMFIGEGPGAEEDIQGRPFVGKAGQLLTKIITAMSFARQDVYITNVVKCRPPQNRTPVKDEIAACRPYLLTQIETIAPRVIVCLGRVATDSFHPSAAGMSSLRGNFIEYGDILVMPTFHPSYLIRNEGNKEIKKQVWQDMQKVMAVLGRK